jgi:subtilisin family serine protease
MPVKVLGADGSGSTCDVVVGMVEATQRGAQIINMSLGAPYACPIAFRAAVEHATAKDVLIVASAGNDALSGAPESAPADCPGVLGVGATDHRDEPGVFSSFGPTVDVSAPGVDIVSTMIDVKKGKHTYGPLSGTSMAAPHVAGLAALVKSRNPSWKPAQISDRIIATSDDIGPVGRDDFFGEGRINAARALTR